MTTLGTTILFISCILLFGIGLIIHYLTYRNGSSFYCIWNSILAGMFTTLLGALIVWVMMDSICLRHSEKEYIFEDKPLQSINLSSNNVIHGQFFLGCGHINGKSINTYDIKNYIKL